MTSVLRLDHISKVIKGKTLVDDISFEVGPGEVFGFLGPNGAGKTTTIRMMVGLIKPTKGNIILGGYNLKQSFIQAMQQVGSIVENPELYSYLTGWENLKQFARMLGGITDERIQSIVRQVNLEERIHDKVKTYSLGMKQRLGIAQALLGNPKLLILDEPTNGLDPSGIKELRQFVRKLVQEDGISVFISSHLLSEIQLMCDRVAIIHKGKLLMVANVDELLDHSRDRIEWKVSPLNKAIELLNQHEDIEDIKITGNQTLLCRFNPELISQYNRFLIENGIDVHSVTEKSMTLEDLFMEMTGGDAVD